MRLSASPPAGLRPLKVRKLFDLLLREYGPQRWWPAEEPFEVAVGAVLTQNTSWANVEKAIAGLKSAGRLDPEWLAEAPLERIASLIRPAGCHNVKADRLRELCRFLIRHGGLEGLQRLGHREQRTGLLSVRGVGPETADSISLYALGFPVFVADGYARRLFSRLGLIHGDVKYDDFRHLVESSEPVRGRSGAKFYNEYHALIVQHGKLRCRTTPRCRKCPLLNRCGHGKRVLESESSGIVLMTRPARRTKRRARPRSRERP